MAYEIAKAVRAAGLGPRRRETVLRPFKTPRSLEGNPKRAGLAVVRAWRDAVKERLLPLLERDGLITDDMRGIDGFFEREGGQISGLVIRFTPSITEWLLRVESWQRRKWAASIQAGAGLDVESFLVPLGSDNRIAAYQSRALSLIQDLNASTKKRLQNLVYSAVTGQRPRKALAKDIQKAMGIERRRAITIARDQTTKLAGKLNQLRNEEAGITTYEWVHSGKAHPREEHVARDGSRFQWADPPGDGHPGEAINCGCTSRAVLDWE